MLTGTAAALAGTSPVAAPFLIATLLVYAGISAVIAVTIQGWHPHPRFGAANLMTLTRLGIAAIFAGVVVEGLLDRSRISAGVAWACVALLSVALVLDGVDGLLARRQALASRFGARFDMEVDALTILLLSILAMLLDKAGAWVALIGLMRYAFVAAALLQPALAAPLSPSLRRKAICVVQYAALLVMLLPITHPPATTAVAAVALAALAWSFAVDIGWLLRRGVRTAI
ncbi:CDP-alcohol phosphatidyltransferase family protein [Inquilinus sp. OTU3971]|uniref:CDP-alcohol phosphatidyltransferase family protein n=1 Tax=Inquilinus sp. OTU3971 TaxID=3043855 RepID=UPI00313CC257